MPQPTFHEDVHSGPFVEFIQGHYVKKRGKSSPPLPEPVEGGETRYAPLAYISEGRWVVGCSLCPNANQVSRVFPFMLCDEPKCEADEWQAVVMPVKDYAVLGELVMRRENPLNQNWNVDEAFEGSPIEYIRRENELHGVA